MLVAKNRIWLAFEGEGKYYTHKSSVLGTTFCCMHTMLIRRLVTCNSYVCLRLHNKAFWCRLDDPLAGVFRRQIGNLDLPATGLVDSSGFLC